MSAPPGVADRYRINQAIPSAHTTSYDDEWSYYAAGDTPALTSVSDIDSNRATGVQDVVLSTDPPTPSLIQITALPPATTSPQAVLPKLPYHRQLNVLYLVPLFIALGIVLGVITAAILLKWRENRWRPLRTSTLLPGPPYVPSANDVEGRLLVHGYPSMEQVSLFAAATPSKFTIHGSRYVPKRTFAWQTPGATQQPHSQPSYTQTIIPSSDGERFTVVTEEDPFFSTSPMITGRSSKSSNDVSLQHTRVSSSLPKSTPGTDSGHQHTNMQKPFRRSMFDILKLKGPYRPVSGTRRRATVLMPDEEPGKKTSTDGVRRVSSPKIVFTGERSSHSTHLSLEGGIDISDMEDALGLLGSQGEKGNLADTPVVLPQQTPLLKQDLLSPPIKSEKAKKPRKVTPFTVKYQGSQKEAINNEDESVNSYISSGIEEKHTDIYTKAPHRRSRTPHKKVSTVGVSRCSPASDTHASVLPLSPPLLMSPPLEKSLFFTTSLSSSASLAGSMNTLLSTHSSPPHHVVMSPELSLFPLPSNRAKATKKLRTKRPEPLLPYPAYPDHVDVQLTPPERSVSGGTKLRSVSPGSPKPKGRSTSAAYREGTTGIWSLGSLSQTSLAIALASSSSSDMLNKVNDIVALGYTKKRTSMGGLLT